jgi:tetratricopeptide (TPR) repeat protein
MKIYLFILGAFFATVSHAQTNRDDAGYEYWRQNPDSALSVYLADLSGYNKMNFINSTCYECLCGLVGDIYAYKKDYARAIAYYDSAAIKYHTPVLTCGAAVNMIVMPLRYKIYLCYKAQDKQKEAIVSLTRHMLDSYDADFFDSAQVADYLQTVKSVYPGETIQSQLSYALENINYFTQIMQQGNSAMREIQISCKISVFETEVDWLEWKYQANEGESIPSVFTKEGCIRRIKQLRVWKMLEHE